MTDRSVSVGTTELWGGMRRPGLAERIVMRRANRIAAGTLSLTTPDGTCRQLKGAEAGPHAAIVINDPRVFSRVLRGGFLGLAEAYCDGDWDAPDLTAFLELGARNRTSLEDGLRRGLVRKAFDQAVHLWRRNSRRGARRNIAAHYDLGNAFFGAWLDSTMTYSAGVFESDRTDLAVAQRAKFRAMAELADIKPSDHVLEIGCGWGGFAQWAVRETGCRVTAITLSPAQYAYCREQVAAAGLDDRIAVRLQDFREISGRYDRIVSIEMLEAVGERLWPVFANQVHALLRPGGRAALQVITIDDAQYPAYRRQVDFVQRHVFPGGMLPSPGALRAMAADAGLGWECETRDGAGYARTLALWQQRFAAAEKRLDPNVFDERFRRLWRFYLSYCEAGFRMGRIDLMRFALCRR